MIGKHRVTRDSNTRWSRRVPCIDGLLPAIKPMRKTSASGCRTYSTLAIDDRKRHLITRKPAPLTCNCDLRQEAYNDRRSEILHEDGRREYVHRLLQIIRPKTYPTRTATYLTVSCLGLIKRIRLQHSPECANALFRLVRRELWQTPMKVLLNILSASIDTTLVFLEDLFVPSGVREAEVDRAREGLPHLSA